MNIVHVLLFQKSFKQCPSCLLWRQFDQRSIWPLPVRWPWPSFPVTSASQACLLFNLQYLGHYLSYYIQTWHDGRPIHGIIYDHARIDDLALMQGHSEKAKAKIQCLIISTTKQATSIILATTVGHFVCHVTLALQTFIWIDQLVLFSDMHWASGFFVKQETEHCNGLNIQHFMHALTTLTW